MSETPVHTPARLRTMASKVYRMGQTFGVQDLREVGDYLAGCAMAADVHGDILQQRDAAREHLSQLLADTARADAAVLEAEGLRSQLEIRGRELSSLRAQCERLQASESRLADEIAGQRLWYQLALVMIQELRPLIPTDKQRLIDPLRAAAVARSDRALLGPAIPLLRRALVWVTLYAQSANDGRAAACANEATQFLESDACRKFSPPSKSSTS